MHTDELLGRFVAALGRSPAVEVTGRELLERYAEPQRHYHDARHLLAVLEALDALGAGVEPPLTVLCAAYWHDACYDPWAADNEVRSAELAAAALRRLGLAPSVVAEVRRLVLLTTGHDPQPDDPHGALLCDADLAVLGAAPERYEAYAAAVREEYAHLDDEAFRLGRAAVLGALLDRPRLFTTVEGRRRWEDTARRQVAAELGRLTGPAAGAGPRP